MGEVVANCGLNFLRSLRSFAANPTARSLVRPLAVTVCLGLRRAQTVLRMQLSRDMIDAAWRSLGPRPRDAATIESLNVRPGPDARESRDLIELCPRRGAIGDRWEHKTWMYLPDGRPDPRVQLAVCNSAWLALMQRLTGVQHHPGDTLFADIDLSVENLPAGARLAAGTAIIEVSDVENDACAKFARHYGPVVFEWIREPAHRPLRLRGLFARVVEPGHVRVGDPLCRLPDQARQA